MKKRTIEKINELILYINLEYISPNDKDLFYEFCFISYIENDFINEADFYSIMKESQKKYKLKFQYNWKYKKILFKIFRVI